MQQCVLLKECRCKILQVFNQCVVSFRPVHRKVKTVLITLYGVGKIAGIGAVGDNEYLQVFIQ